MKLGELQQNISVPKNKHNDFGGYDYRSAEDIMTALKAQLGEEDHITVRDELKQVGDRYYIKATVHLYLEEEDEKYYTTAYARERKKKKKSDPAQITGAASSYARKYALNGLLALGSEGDVDSYQNDNQNDTVNVKKATEKIQSINDMHELRQYWSNLPPEVQKKVKDVKDKKKQSLTPRTDGGNDNPMTDSQFEFIKDLTSNDKIDTEAILEEKGVSNLEELNKDQASDVIEGITEENKYRADEEVIEV